MGQEVKGEVDSKGWNVLEYKINFRGIFKKKAARDRTEENYRRKSTNESCR